MLMTFTIKHLINQLILLTIRLISRLNYDETRWTFGELMSDENNIELAAHMTKQVAHFKVFKLIIFPN